ncbi:hypothetical protein LJR098_004170 [Rhizobium sp. LjRoot98]|uniref:hypothetical protein n=1 Tax=Rhizobium sp. LjRoot98 TaxID=3342345 RepID=UPI003ECED385
MNKFRRVLGAAVVFGGITILLIGFPDMLDQTAADIVKPRQDHSRSGEPLDESPDEMEAALAVERDLQDAMQSNQQQLSKPFSDFSEAYESTLRSRHDAAALLSKDVLVPGDCNIGGLESIAIAPDEFVQSNALNRGKNDLENTRTKYVEEGRRYNFIFSSDHPPSGTSEVVGLVGRTLEHIEAINAEYAIFCNEAEQSMQKLLGSTDAPRITKIAEGLQKKQSEASNEVKAAVLAMNTAVDAIDANLVNWLAEPLRTAQARRN